MTKIAYIDHSYHQKTRSSQFFIDLLERLGKVDVFWDESWGGGAALDIGTINSTKYEMVVFFQVLYPMALLSNLTCQKIVLVPMYDSIPEPTAQYWVQYRGCFVVAFARRIYRATWRAGVSSFYLQYFVNPDEFEDEPVKDFRKIFFWERNNDFTGEMVEKLFSSLDGYKVHHHVAPDSRGLAEVKVRSGWSQSTWFETRKEYEAVLRLCGVYVAPRKREGIGMSFLEAMARGQVVVGFRYPTLSEYVRNKRNGVLLKEGKVPISGKVNWSRLGDAARKTSRKGYLKYQERLVMLEGVLELFLLGQLKPRWPIVYYLIWPWYGLKKFLKDLLHPLKQRFLSRLGQRGV